AESLAYAPHAGWDPPPRAPGRLAPSTGALMGVHSDDDDDYKPEEQGITKLEQALGRRLDINNRYYGDFDEFAKEGAMSWMETWDVEHGRIPLVGWGCTDSDKVNNGSWDEVIRQTAQIMKAFGHEFFMRYCWEMDGDRKQGEVKGPEKFISAWRRMHGIFQAEGATNVVWVWTPNAAGFKDKRKYTDDQPPAPFFYPGDEYVDWIAADGYNWGVSKRDQGDRWRHVIEIFDEFMIFARQHPKPIMIGEYGAQEQPSDPEAKPHWFSTAHETFQAKPRTAECQWCGAYSDVAAVVYFDVDYGKHGDWRIMSSPESLAAYKVASDDPWFHQVDTIGWPPSTNRASTPPG
ncbi:MAG: glycoside hydrolase family 26 protein, partial [Acidimicrobiia bacterium]